MNGAATRGKNLHEILKRSSKPVHMKMSTQKSQATRSCHKGHGRVEHWINKCREMSWTIQYDMKTPQVNIGKDKYSAARHILQAKTKATATTTSQPLRSVTSPMCRGDSGTSATAWRCIESSGTFISIGYWGGHFSDSTVLHHTHSCKKPLLVIPMKTLCFTKLTLVQISLYLILFSLPEWRDEWVLE